MKCQNCGNDMMEGYLQAGRIVAFNKQRHKISLLSKDKEDVMIAQNSFANTDFKGHICKQCGLIVFDYKNPIVKAF